MVSKACRGVSFMGITPTLGLFSRMAPAALPFPNTKKYQICTVKTEIMETTCITIIMIYQLWSVVFQFCHSKHFCKFAMNSSIDSIKYLKTNLFIEVTYTKQWYSTTVILRCRSTMIETFGNPSLDWCSNSEAGLWSTKDTKSWYKVTLLWNITSKKQRLVFVACKYPTFFYSRRFYITK